MAKMLDMADPLTARRLAGEIVTGDEDWARRFMRIAAEVASWSKDPNHQVGALVVADKGRQLSPGYNGFPRGLADTRVRLEGDEKNLLMVHAERNALDNAGFDVSGATMYVTRFPCLGCALSIISRGIAVLAAPPLDDPSSGWWTEQCAAKHYLQEAGVLVVQVG